MDLLVPLAFVGAGEPSAARVARKRLLTSVRSDVRGEVVRAREAAETDVALEGLLARVDAEVSREFI